MPEESVTLPRTTALFLICVSSASRTSFVVMPTSLRGPVGGPVSEVAPGPGGARLQRLDRGGQARRRVQPVRRAGLRFDAAGRLLLVVDDDPPLGAHHL